MVESLSKSLSRAWSYFHLLKGLHEGSKENVIALKRFSWLFEEIWRGLFDALFAKVGTLVDATKSTYSLPNLVKLVKRYGDADLKTFLPEA
jgi:hypothetical protein